MAQLNVEKLGLTTLVWIRINRYSESESSLAPKHRSEEVDGVFYSYDKEDNLVAVALTITEGNLRGDLQEIHQRIKERMSSEDYKQLQLEIEDLLGILVPNPFF